MMKVFQPVAAYAGLILVTGGPSLAKTLSERAVDNPTPENFGRRIDATVAVLGDYVYINGGQVTQLADEVTDGFKHLNMVNTTLSLSLSSSWTNATLALRSIPKPATPVGASITWIDASISSLYEWGGYTSFRGPPADNVVWKFTADGKGGGVWTQVTPTNIVAFNNAVRPVYAPFTSHDHVGYALGGVVTPTSGDSIVISGLVSFDTGSLEWANASSSGYGRYGTNNGGQMEYAPFGPNGVLVVLGGLEAPVGSVNKWTSLSWDTVRFVDPSTGRWYSQPTTGPRPTNRVDFCSVGVQGPNGTYEIFIYGGFASMENRTVADMYVLSLPGFVFFKLPNVDVPRANHACVLVGPSSGKGHEQASRQMLSVGGAEYYQGNRTLKAALDSDPWKQGLGVFDLTDMVWKNQYNAGADPYDTPKMVRDWYAQGGIDSVTWTNEEIKAMFKPGASKGADPGNGTSNPSEAPRSHVGAIVGGTIGGIAGILLLTALVVLLRRHRVRQRQGHQPQPQQIGWSKAELPTEGVKQQRLDNIYYPELDSNHGHSELGPECRHEMPG